MNNKSDSMKLNGERRVMVGLCCLVALAVALVGSGRVHTLLHKAEQEPQNAASSAFDKREWAARMGNPQDMRAIAADLFGHWKRTHDEKALNEAVKLWLAAAEKGDSISQAMVGVLYDEGLGLQQDAEKAVKWYRKAAERGVVMAQYNLAYCYEFGEGVEQDWEKAREWYAKAAAQGDEKARKALQEPREKDAAR